MLDLNEIFNNNTMTFKRVILFEDGLWCLYEKMPKDMDARYHVIHRCANTVRSISLTYDRPNVCATCSEPAPEGIMALARMQRAGMNDSEPFELLEIE